MVVRLLLAGSLLVALSACGAKLAPLQERAWDAFKDCQQEARSATLEQITEDGGINGGGTSALLIVDTGADRTILTPRLLDRLGVIVPADAPRRKIRVIGGQTLDVPFMRISTLGVGDAAIANPEIGVYEIFPDEPIIDGLLGGDFLQRFRVTLDRTARHMRLEQLAK